MTVVDAPVRLTSWPRRVGGREPALRVAVVVAVVLLWALAARLTAGTLVIPYPWDAVRQLITDLPTLVQVNTPATLRTALWGLAAGAVVTIPLALLSLLSRTLENFILQVAVTVHAVPFIALAPIVVVALPGETARITMAALQVYFPLLVSTLLGLRAADERALEVVRVSGGSRLDEVLRVRLPGAVPAMLAGLQIAVPAALIGALIAEFFGTDRGLGAFLVQAQSDLDAARTWGTALYITALALAQFALLSWVSRRVRWSANAATVSAVVDGAGRVRAGRWTVGGATVAAVAVLLAAWQSLRSVFHLSSFFVKTPEEVLDYLRSGGHVAVAFLVPTEAPSFWDTFLPGLGRTLTDAAGGFVLGTVGAAAVSLLFISSPGVERALLPLLLGIRSVPLIALVPVFTLVIGRNAVSTTVLVTLITFFPTLINVLAALRRVPHSACDVVTVSGGSSAATTRLVRLFYALPAFVESLRIAIPAAVAGATLAEWMSTGTGLGYMLTYAAERSDYLALWSAGVLLSLVVLVLYWAAGLAGSLLLKGTGLDDGLRT